MRLEMELVTEWRQVLAHDVLLSEYTCERGEVKAFVKMLAVKRWVACIVGQKLYITKHFSLCSEAQAWADQQLNVTVQ
jgi:hypothetical protein